MKKSGILNRDLLSAIATLGHCDTFVVADCGLPIPDDIPVIDLAIVFGEPSFDVVVNAILADVEIQAVTLADGTPSHIVDMLSGFSTHTISHQELKNRTKEAKFVVRTGENIPYSNVIFECGVPFS